MGVEKLTSKEIIEKLELVFGDNISAYAYNEYTEIDDEDVEGFSYDRERAEEISKIKNDFYKSIESNLPDNYQERKLHPDFIKYSEMPGHYGELNRQILDFLGLGEIKEVQQKGGTDEGSNWYTIKYFVDHNVYIKTTGWYQSHDGTYFENGIGSEVKPEAKTITVYN